jgi:hypothetical protein
MGAAPRMHDNEHTAYGRRWDVETVAAARQRDRVRRGAYLKHNLPGYVPDTPVAEVLVAMQGGTAI